MALKIAVLLGGTSAERDVSLVSGMAIAKSLKHSGHEVYAIDCAFGDRLITDWDKPTEGIIHVNPSDIEKERAQLDRNLFQTLDFVLRENIQVVFIGLHGGYGENGQLQTLLDLANIPYTGSGALASAICMNKHLTKILFTHNQIPTPPWVWLQENKLPPETEIAHLGWPLVVKPNEQGSTVGMSLVHEYSRLTDALNTAFLYSETVILEKFIAGHEITAGILGEEALPVIEIIPEGGFYDYATKYQGGKARYIIPAEISDNSALKLRHTALAAFRALDCRDYARIDFRLTEDGGEFYCLEINTLPGMTDTSLVPKAAKAVGIDFHELIERLVQMAAARKKE